MTKPVTDMSFEELCDFIERAEDRAYDAALEGDIATADKIDAGAQAAHNERKTRPEWDQVPF